MLLVNSSFLFFSFLLLVLFCKLAARDIQKWEGLPLGPFLGKSFGKYPIFIATYL